MVKILIESNINIYQQYIKRDLSVDEIKDLFEQNVGLLSLEKCSNTLHHV